MPFGACQIFCGLNTVHHPLDFILLLTPGRIFWVLESSHDKGIYQVDVFSKLEWTYAHK
jgi:hypothetical protein